MSGADDRPEDWNYRQRCSYDDSVKQIVALQNYQELYSYMTNRLCELTKNTWKEIANVMTDEVIIGARKISKLNQFGCLSGLDDFTKNIAQALLRPGVDNLPVYRESWSRWGENILVKAYDSFRDNTVAKLYSKAAGERTRQKN